MRRKKKPVPVIRKSTPTEVVQACELVKGQFIRTRSGEVLRLSAARKRDGMVRCQFEGHRGVFTLPRSAPVHRFAIPI